MTANALAVTLCPMRYLGDARALRQGLAGLLSEASHHVQHTGGNQVA